MPDTTATAVAHGAKVHPTAELTREQAAEACGVSRDTIRRRQREGLLPNARQTGADQHWLIPVSDLVTSGLLPADRVAAAVAVVEAVEDRKAAADVRADLAEALADNRGLRQLVATLEDQVAFLRSMMQGSAA